MSYYNCGAILNHVRVPSKKALKEAMANHPEEVYFEGTAEMFQTVEGYRGNEIPEGIKLSVVGPDPRTNRRWYATVEMVKGKIKVS